MTETLRGMGWLRDRPDQRDYTPDHEEVAQLLAKAKIPKSGGGGALPATVDLRGWCSPIDDQGQLGSCTAHAAVGLLEYCERRTVGNFVNASRLFVYKTSRNLLGINGDTGAYLRTAMASLALFGAPPEKYWPYVVAQFDNEPPTFVYQIGEHFEALSYFRLDPPGTTPAALLRRIKTYLAGGLPSMFGFTVYSSVQQADHTGKIPYPGADERAVGGHAIVAVGYDDAIEIVSASSKAPSTTGALLIRNSWGTGWGDHGYGWLPYDYVTRAQAVDWWSLIRAAWVDTGQFGLE